MTFPDPAMFDNKADAIEYVATLASFRQPQLIVDGLNIIHATHLFGIQEYAMLRYWAFASKPTVKECSTVTGINITTVNDFAHQHLTAFNQTYDNETTRRTRVYNWHHVNPDGCIRDCAEGLNIPCSTVIGDARALGFTFTHATLRNGDKIFAR